MRPLVLVILDGWGYSPQKLGNAILSAETPVIDDIAQHYPALLLQASGKSVGLEWAEPGNSEVGHLTIGAGRTVFQYSTRINRAVENGELHRNKALLAAMSHAARNNSALHLVGLLGSGTVHSSTGHLFSLMDMAKQNGVGRMNLHLFADGKDSGLKEAPALIQKVRDRMAQIGLGTIATLIGRWYAMDRDTNWERTQAAYDLMTDGAGETDGGDLLQKLAASYAHDLNDTKLPPIVADPSGLIRDGDAVIFFNFREDSMRQLTRAFVEPEFDRFPRRQFSNLFVTLMTHYLDLPGLNVAFPLPEIKNGLAETISAAGFKQLHIAETEKYAHATYFFNCLRNEPFPGETDILAESHKQHAEHPEMKAPEIADRFVAAFGNEPPEFTVINFANADILSHMGNLEIAAQGVGHIDRALGRVRQTVAERNGILVVTADHGNAESLIYKTTGEAETRHNSNPVPLYLVAAEYERYRDPQVVRQSIENSTGLLSDVAPTILELMGKQKPVEMTGESLLSQLV